ncbi:hypothetical protein SKAU_G00383560 [Synaphobranchus kaupii]|uniref:Uncharacterized protein n=1 Tax=Synaphobranchus kaupii TaxID=118154 RepID=A0A9Q1EEB7_SYNKA|nr:hypothetical protein SKAU_G00383560 [Synaphobranchus kaupii]
MNGRTSRARALLRQGHESARRAALSAGYDGGVLPVEEKDGARRISSFDSGLGRPPLSEGCDVVEEKTSGTLPRSHKDSFAYAPAAMILISGIRPGKQRA